MAKHMIPLVRDGGLYASRKWTPLVMDGGYTQGGGGEPEPAWEYKYVAGMSPLLLAAALNKPIKSLTQYGLCSQSGTPTPEAPVDIVCNNGTLKVRHQSGLPVRYQLLSYLRSNTAVDVGIKTTKDTELEAAWTRITSGVQYLYQSDNISSGSTNTAAYIKPGGNWRFGNRSVSISPSQNERYVSIQNSNGVLLNGEQVASYGTIESFTSTNTLKVLVGSGASVQIEYLKVRQSGVLVRDLVPVRDTVYGIYGFYDLVGGTFYTNANARFTPGADADDPIEVVAVGTPEVLTVSGVNLCNPALYTVDGWYVGANNTVTNSSANGTLLFPCKPNTTYSWWHTAGAGGCRAFELPTDTITQGQEASWAVGSPAYTDANVIKKCTTSASAKLLCVLFGRDATGVGRTIEDQLADFMLVEGDITTATSYEPYHAPQTATVPDLYAVGDYKDEVDLVSGTVTHKVGAYVITGAEAWSKYNDVFLCNDAISPADLGTACLCTSYAGIKGSTTLSSMRDGQIKTGTASNASRLFIRDDSCATADDLKAKLSAMLAAGTPPILVYPLEEETTERITPQPLHTNDGDNVASVTAMVSPIQLSAEYAILSEAG